MALHRSRGQLEAVGGLVNRILHDLGLDKRLRENKAIEAWEEIVGETIGEQTRPTAIRDGVLFVDVTSNVWMQELGLLREQIVAELNKHLGEPLVRKIVLSIERSPRSADEDRRSEGEEDE